MQQAQEDDETLVPYREIAAGARGGAFLLRNGLRYRRADKGLPDRLVVPVSWR